MALLELTGVDVAYGAVRAVSDLHLQVDHGEIVCLLGANGAGKTSTLRAISGVVRVPAGSITLDGRQLVGMRSDRIASLGIAHLPERRGIFGTLTVVENLEVGAHGAGVPRAETRRRVSDLLEVFPQLGRRMAQRAGTLSGGEQQMLGLARALLTRPRLLLIDELSFGLAPAVVETLFQHVAAVADGGTAVLLVEQFVSKALGVASRAYVLEKGAVVHSGPAAALASDPAFVEESYLGTRSAGTEHDLPCVEERVSVGVPGNLLRELGRTAGAEGCTAEELIVRSLQERLRQRIPASEVEPTADAGARRRARGEDDG